MNSKFTSSFNVNNYTQEELLIMEFAGHFIHATEVQMEAAMQEVSFGMTTAEAVSEAILLSKNSRKAVALAKAGVLHIDDATNEKRIYKRYAIVQHVDDDGSETLEDYDNEETARKAFEAIRTNGYHASEYEDILDAKITFDEFEKVVFTMDIELWDERGNHEGFETIEHTPIEIRNGKVVEDETKKNPLEEFTVRELLDEIRKRAMQENIITSASSLCLMTLESAHSEVKHKLHNCNGVDIGNDNYYIDPQEYVGESDLDDLVQRANEFGIGLINVY